MNEKIIPLIDDIILDIQEENYDSALARLGRLRRAFLKGVK